MVGQMTRVAIGALTYMRPVGLARLLRELDRLEIPDDVEVRGHDGERGSIQAKLLAER